MLKLEQYTPYMWTNDNIDLYVSDDHIQIHKEQRKKKEHPKKEKKILEKEQWFIPEEQNKYFWHMYVLLHHQDKYTFFGNKKQIENEDKFKWIDELQKEKKNMDIRVPLRKHSIKIDDVINDIASSMYISLESFIALCVLFNIPIAVTRGNFVFFIKREDSEDKYVWVRTKDRAIHYEKKTREELLEKHVLGHTIHKPMLSASAYKVSELKDICITLGLSYTDDKGKVKKKQDLYTHIIERNSI